MVLMLTVTGKQGARCIDATLHPATSCVRRRTLGRTDHDRPRIARQYATMSKRSQSPATAAMATRVSKLPPPFVSSKQDPYPLGNNHDLSTFLRQRFSPTVIPPPLPDDKSSSLNSFYFPDSYTQDLVAIIDTCLNECYDVPRARKVLESMRMSNSGEYLLNTVMFNKFLRAYATMAVRHDGHRDEWLHEAWALFDSMEVAESSAKPNAETYATMILLLKRHDPDSTRPSNVASRSSEELLRKVMAGDVLLPSLVPACGHVADNEQECDEMVRLISRTVAAMGYPKMVHELGRAVEQVDLIPDHKKITPAIRPVVRLKPRGEVQTEVKFDADGSIKEVAPEGDSKEEVFEVPYNLRMLRHSLGELDISHRAIGDDLWTRQRLLEQSVYDVAVERLKHEHEMLEKLQNHSTGIHDKSLRALMWEWHQKLVERLEDDISVLIKEEAEQAASYNKITALRLGSFVSLLKPDKLSLIAILELMNMSGTGGVSDGMKIARALLTVGRAVEDEYQAEVSRKYGIPMQSYNPGSLPRSSLFSSSGYEMLHERRIAARHELENAEQYRAPWTQQIRLKVGSFLVDCLMDIATIERHTVDRRTGKKYSEHQPAFVHAYEYIRGHKLGVIKLNPALVERLTRDNVGETIHPRQLPMLTKPRPWTGVQEGGYLTTVTPAMRYKQAVEQFVYLREASGQGKLELIYAGLDVLGATPWQINKAVFEVVTKVWNFGDRFLKIPPAVYEVSEPVPPPDFETNPRSKMDHMARVKEWAHSNANCHSERCSINYKLEIAKAFLGDIFYFPHNMDFRGRAYPVPPHLNHIGDDLSRSLLKFGEAKPLGESGLRWLKIHLSNLFGFDKASFSERVEFTMAHMDDIYDSAEKPLDGAKWWMKADDPWQCLATCMELRAALESPDPLKYESCLPVHQDGTCNGLQHYAALGGDGQGAKQVNLDVTDRPSDVYTFVANMLDEVIARDAAKGIPEAQIIQGKVTRKVVKQTVMTTVYGVTYVGARDQIEKQLRGKIPVQERWKASAYLAKKTLAAIGDLFSGAKAIQNWLTLTAKLIAKSIPEDRLQAAMGMEVWSRRRGRAPSRLAFNRISKEQMSTVIWTTALGLPIVQPYRKTKRRQIMTKIQSVYISDPNAPAEVNANKQASAFPPNFVHSLDATHMMLTALECRTAGITFAAVHDSYWTHACTIDKMSAFIRDTFIELHSSDVLPNLEAEFKARYANHKVPARALFEGKWSLLKKTRDMGCNITVPAEVEERLHQTAGEEQTELMQDPESETASEECEDSEEVPEEMELHGMLTQLGPGVRFSKITNEEHGQTGRFVNLLDLFPPLPKKGNFEVSRIKDSQYFFS